MRSRVQLAVCALVLLCGARSASGQAAGVVRGKVTDAATARPIAGAQVVLVGSASGARTDASGEYVVSAVPTGVRALQVTHVGYTAALRQVTVAAGADARADFALQASVVKLNELVVTGVPDATRRRAVGAGVATVAAADVDAPVSSVGQLLQGREAGVTAYSASGTVGTAGVIALRGATSINESNAPVIYVDGVRVDASEKPLFYFSLGGQSTSRLNDINPLDIERVEIVKGAAASTLYGSEASKGVIQIFTKKGRPGSSAMSASVRVGGSRIPSVFPNQHPDPQYPSANDLIENGTLEQYSLSLRGGADQLRHYVSAGYQRENGSFPSNSFERANGRVNLSLMPFSNVTADLSSGLVWSRTQLPFNDNSVLGILYNALRSNPAVLGSEEDPWGSTFLLPVEYALDVENVDQTYRFTQGVTVKHDAGRGFTQRAMAGIDIVNGTGVTRWPFAPNGFLPRGGRWIAQRDNLNANLEYSASLENRLREGVESVLSAGGQLYTVRDSRVYSAGGDFPTPGLELLGATTTGIEVNEEVLDYTTGGVFVQEQVGFGDRLFLVAGVRVDGSSAFGEDFGLQPYPKASASYVISDESWFRLPAVSSLRLRAGFGMAGVQPGAFDAMRTYSPFAANGGEPAIHAEAIGNPNLAPEVSHEWEGGFDAGFFDERLELNATAYHQRTVDALLSQAVAPSLGFLTSQLVNVGEVRNVGVELAAKATLWQAERRSWDVNVSYAYNQNEVVTLGGAQPVGSDATFGTRVAEGFPIGGKWQFVQVGQTATGMPVRSDTAYYMGTGIAPHNGGFGSRLGLGNVELFATGQWAAGHVVTNRTRANMIRARTGEEYHSLVLANNDSPTAPKTDAVKALFARGAIIGEYTEPGDWLRVRELGLSYSLPRRFASVFGSDGAKLSVTGRNLFLMTKYSGPEPEVAATLVTPAADSFVPGNRQFATSVVGNDLYTVPQPRQVVVGFDVQF